MLYWEEPGCKPPPVCFEQQMAALHIPGIPCQSLIYHSCLVASDSGTRGIQEDSSLTSLLEIFFLGGEWGVEVLKLHGF